MNELLICRNCTHVNQPEEGQIPAMCPKCLSCSWIIAPASARQVFECMRVAEAKSFHAALVRVIRRRSRWV